MCKDIASWTKLERETTVILMLWCWGCFYIKHIIVQQQNIGYKFEKLTQLLLFSHGTEVAYEVWRASNSQFVPEQRIITCLCKLALYYKHHMFPLNIPIYIHILLYNYFQNLVHFTYGFMVFNSQCLFMLKSDW